MFHGVQHLLDLVVDCLPSPLDRPPVDGLHPKTKDALRKPDASEPMSALAFKTVAETNGDLVYIRVYSGEMKPGETYTNTTNGKKERIARFYRMMGDKRISAGEGRPRRHRRGDGPVRDVHGQHPVRPGPADRAGGDPVPEAGHRAGADVQPRRSTAGKVGEALNRLVRDDPTLKTHTDEETKDTIISGMGELHLEISIEKLKRAVGVPQEDTEADHARQAAGGVPPVPGADGGLRVQVPEADRRPRQVRRDRR